MTLDESDNVETEPYLQAVREALDDKFDNVITLCTKEIDKPGKSICHMSHDLGAVTIFRFLELGLGLGLGLDWV